LFAYGSLREAESDHEALRGATALGEAIVPGARLVDLGPYPALVEVGAANAPKECTVVGELYEVDEVILCRVDVIKQHPALFQRKQITLADGRAAYTYVMNAEQLRGRKRLPSGDWKRRFEPPRRAEFTQPRRWHR